MNMSNPNQIRPGLNGNGGQSESNKPVFDEGGSLVDLVWIETRRDLSTVITKEADELV